MSGRGGEEVSRYWIGTRDRGSFLMEAAAHVITLESLPHGLLLCREQPRELPRQLHHAAVALAFFLAAALGLQFVIALRDGFNGGAEQSHDRARFRPVLRAL